jgi:hypothetical protein
MHRLAPICDVTNCELCAHASLIYEKVYHQLHVPLEKPSTTQHPRLISYAPTSRNPIIEKAALAVISDPHPVTSIYPTSLPVINGVFTHDKGKLFAHNIQQSIKRDNLDSNNPKQGLFADCKENLQTVSKKPRLEPKPTIVSSASGNFVVAEKQEHSVQFKFTPYQLQYNQQNDTKKKRRFEELREHGRADGYYCFHKMLPQPTEACCGQCFRIGL